MSMARTRARKYRRGVEPQLSVRFARKIARDEARKHAAVSTGPPKGKRINRGKKLRLIAQRLRR